MGVMTSYFISAVAPDSLIVHVPDLLLLAGGEGEGVAGGKRQWRGF